MRSMSEADTSLVFEELFSRYGYPAHLVTDNFATFTGLAFQNLMKKGGIRHSTTPPHHPATNGAAENFVDTFKRKVTCMLKDGLTLDQSVKQFLSDYRTTEHAATKQTPAKLFLGRELRTRFSLMRPIHSETKMLNHQQRQIQNHPGKQGRKFEVVVTPGSDTRVATPKW